MKFITIAILGLILSISSLSGLDQMSVLPSEQAEAIKTIMKTLDIPDTKGNRESVLDAVETHMSDDWSAHWVSNKSISGSKYKNNKYVKFVDFTVFNKTRVSNVTFIHFKKEKQLFVNGKEFIDAGLDLVMTKYDQFKKNSELEITRDSDNYAVFNKKGYISYSSIRAEKPAGMVIYENSYNYDIDGE